MTSQPLKRDVQRMRTQTDGELMTRSGMTQPPHARPGRAPDTQGRVGGGGTRPERGPRRRLRTPLVRIERDVRGGMLEIR